MVQANCNKQKCQSLFSGAKNKIVNLLSAEWALRELKIKKEKTFVDVWINNYASADFWQVLGFCCCNRSTPITPLDGNAEMLYATIY